MNTLYNSLLIISILVAGGFAFYTFIQAKKQGKKLALLKKQNQQLLAQFEEINAAHAKLVESVKYLQEVNATKDKFFSIIAHDLKSPLNTIIGFLQLLNDHVDAFTTDELKNFAGSMNKSVKNLLGLLDNLLHWSR